MKGPHATCNLPPASRNRGQRSSDKLMTQRYQAQFAKQLVNQLIAILQRDQQAALAVLNASRPPGRTLNPFAAFFKEAAPIQNWPAVVLVARNTQFDPASDAALRTETPTFVCRIANFG